MSVDALCVKCPTCGAGVAKLCEKPNVGGFCPVHKTRIKAAFQAKLRDAKPQGYAMPNTIRFQPYGSAIQSIDKTSAAWHLIARANSVLSTLDPQVVSASTDIIQRALALDELRAQGANEEILSADKEALRECVTALGESGRFVLSLDQLLILLGAK